MRVSVPRRFYAGCLAFLVAGVALQAQPTGSIRLSTYLGGESDEAAAWALYDELGDLWLCGNTNGPGLPFPEGVEPTGFSEDQDVFVMKLAVSEDDFGDRSYQVQDTLILGGTGRDVCRILHLAPGNRIFLGGATESNDLPMLEGELVGTNENVWLAEIGVGADGRLSMFSGRLLGLAGEGFVELSYLAHLEQSDGSLKLFASGIVGGAEDATLRLGPSVTLQPSFIDGFVVRLDDELVPERGFAFGEEGVDSAGLLIMGDAPRCRDLLRAIGVDQDDATDDLGCFVGAATSAAIGEVVNPFAEEGRQPGVIVGFSPRNMVQRAVGFVPTEVGGQDYLPVWPFGEGPADSAEADETPWFTVGVLRDADRNASLAIAALEGLLLFREPDAFPTDAFWRETEPYSSVWPTVPACVRSPAGLTAFASTARPCMNSLTPSDPCASLAVPTAP